MVVVLVILAVLITAKSLLVCVCVWVVLFFFLLFLVFHAVHALLRRLQPPFQLGCKYRLALATRQAPARRSTHAVQGHAPCHRARAFCPPLVPQPQQPAPVVPFSFADAKSRSHPPLSRPRRRSRRPALRRS